MVNKAALVKQFCRAVGGIMITPMVVEEWTKMDEVMNMVFTPSDIETIAPRIKQMGITYSAQAMTLYLR